MVSPKKGTDNKVMSKGDTKKIATTVGNGKLPNGTKNRTMARTKHIPRPKNDQNALADRPIMLRMPLLKMATKARLSRARTAMIWDSGKSALSNLIIASLSGMIPMPRARPANATIGRWVHSVSFIAPSQKQFASPLRNRNPILALSVNFRAIKHFRLAIQKIISGL